MSDNAERDAIERNIKAAREGIGRELDELDSRITEMKAKATSKVPYVAAGAVAIGFVLAFAPRGIRALFTRRKSKRKSKRAAGPSSRPTSARPETGKKTP